MERKDLSLADLSTQVKQHLASLEAAGVEWVPAPPKRAAPRSFAPNAPKKEAAVVLASPLHAAPEAARGSPETDRPAAPVPSLFQVSSVESTPPGLPPEERRRELAVLANRVVSCTRCSELVATRTQTVFGVGSIDAVLCFVGEAPGFNEDKQGEPFVGEAGQLLNRIVTACGMKREEVYICNIIKCRPPGNRLPLPNEAANCREYLVRQLELVQPKFLCALGACLSQNLLQTTQSVGRLRGRFHDYQGIPVLCTYHPAYLLRNPEKKKDVWEDMKLLLAKMGRPVPGK